MKQYLVSRYEILPQSERKECNWSHLHKDDVKGQWRTITWPICKRTFSLPIHYVPVRKSDWDTALSSMERVKVLEEEKQQESNDMNTERVHLNKIITDLQSEVNCKDNIATALSDSIATLEAKVKELEETLKAKERAITIGEKILNIKSHDSAPNTILAQRMYSMAN